MEGSKLLELIKTLNKEEIKALGNFLEAYNRTNSSIFLLYTYLKKLHPLYPEKKIQKEVVFKKIMPKGKEFNIKRIRDIMSTLSRQIEDFLLKEELDKNEIEREFLMLNILKKRKQDKLFFQKIRLLQKKWEQKPLQGIEQYHHQYKLLHQYYYHPNASLYSEKEVSLNDLMEKMDQYYFASKLCGTVSLEHMKNLSIAPKDARPVFLMTEIMETSTIPLFQENPHIDIFRRFFRSYTEQDYSDYTALKDRYFKQINIFSESEQHDLFLLLQSYCYENYRQGKPEFLKEVFELNKFAVEQNIVIEEGYIATDVFRNIVQISCAVKEFEWTAHFINDYGKCLKEDNQEDTIYLCEAVLQFHQENFEATLSKLQVVKIQDVLYGIQVRCLQLQCYYELDDTYEEAFYNLTNAFSVFLSRTKNLPPTVKKASLNFIQISKKLQNQKYSPDKNVAALVEELQSMDYIANKQWLMVKANQLLALQD